MSRRSGSAPAAGGACFFSPSSQAKDQASIPGACRPLPTPCRARSWSAPALPGCAEPSLQPLPAPESTSVLTLACLRGSPASGVETVMCSSPRPQWEAYLEHVASALDSCGAPLRTTTAAASEHGCLRISALVGPLPDPGPVQTFPVGRSLPEALRLLAPWPESCWSSALPPGLSLHPQAVAALRGCLDCASGEPIDSVCLFTDGSFVDGVSSWAVICVAFCGEVPCGVKWLSSRVCVQRDSPVWLGAISHGAQEAELSAVSVALLWSLSLQGCFPVVIRSDSLSTVKRAGGLWNFADCDVLAGSCRALAQAAGVFGSQPWQDVQHIYAHVGIGFNELADSIAKAAAQHSCPASFLPPVGPWVRDGSIHQLWLILESCRRPDLWPAMLGTHFSSPLGVEASGLVAESYFGHVGCVEPVSQSRSWARLTVVTTNVQTLEDGGGLHGHEGRVAYLRAQMSTVGAHVVAVQEARTPRTATFLSDSYIRLCGGCSAKGQLGVELWFRRTPSSDGIAFRSDELTVVLFDVRVLVVKVASPHLQGVVACIHAPTSQDPHRQAWWQQLLCDLDRVVSRRPLLLVGDWNARFSASLHSRVGDLLCSSQESLPPAVLQLLHQHDLWLPSTFASSHSGPSATWFSSGRARPSRIDYIAIPSGWATEPDSSATLPDVDLGHSSIDHLAVRLHVWVWAARGGGGRRTKPPRFDRKAMGTAEGQVILREICAKAPLLPWALDASSHYYAVQEHFCRELARAFPDRGRKRACSFITDSTWVLKEYRTWLKKQTLRHKLWAKSCDVTAAFFAWNRGRTFQVSYWLVSARLCGEARRMWQFVQSVRDTKDELRRALRQDRKDYLADLARQSSSLPTRDVVSKLRPLLQHSGRKGQGFAGIPAVRLESGQLALDEEQARDRWIRHFAANEGGVRISQSDAVVDYRQRLLLDCTSPCLIAQGEIPTRCQLERSMLAATCGKASGPDCIPPELLHFGGGALSLSLYQLFLKCVVRRDEPLIMKGGDLHHLWKGKQSPEECSSHRAILVSSVVGKAVHSTIRRCCVAPMLTSASPLQVGGLPQYPVTYASHCVRLFQSWRRRCSHFLVFLDLREAFYRVCRFLLPSAVPTEEELAVVFSRLQMPPSSFEEFRRFVAGRDAMQTAGASPWLCSLMREIMSDTWFRVGGQRDLVRTSLGVRPGDSLADCLFFFLFAEVLRDTRSRLRQQQLLLQVPWRCSMLGCVHVCPQVPAENVALLDSVWMDDACLMSPALAAESALQDLASVAGALVDSCVSRGLQPSLAANKTEAMLSLHGPSSKQVRRDFLSDDQPSVPRASVHWPDSRIRVVAQYRHLGGQLHHKGHLLVEVRVRVAQAWQAYRARRRPLFAQRQVALADKMLLMRSLVCSVLFFGSGTWPDLDQKGVRALQSCYVGICRAILGYHFRSDVFRLSEERVLALCGVPSLVVCLHAERLTYLASFVRLNVREAWALAHAEGRWLQLVRESLRWLWQHTEFATTCSCWEDAWDIWRRDISARPRRWKALIRRAVSTAARREALREGWQQCRGTLVQGLLRSGAAVQGFKDEVRGIELHHTYFCGLCGRLFDSKQKWSVHAFKVHGRVRDTRCLTSGDQCPACLKQYGSNIRLCAHLQYSQSCRVKLQRASFACIPGPGIGSRKADYGHGFVGAVKQACGPQGLFALEEANAACLPQVPEAMQASLRRFVHYPHSNCVETLEALRGALCVSCVGPDVITAAVLWGQTCLEEAYEELTLLAACLQDIAFKWATEHWTPQWLCGTTVRNREQCALFKNSELLLFDLEIEFPSIEEGSLVVSGGGLLVSAQPIPEKLRCYHLGWAACFDIGSFSHGDDWTAKVRRFWDSREDLGLTLVYLPDVAAPVVPEQGLLRYQLYQARRDSDFLQQDAILLSMQLWIGRLPFAVVMPLADAAVFSALCRLPGMQHFRQDGRILLCNCTRSSLPTHLFHLFNSVPPEAESNLDTTPQM